MTIIYFHASCAMFSQTKYFHFSLQYSRGSQADFFIIERYVEKGVHCTGISAHALHMQLPRICMGNRTIVMPVYSNVTVLKLWLICPLLRRSRVCTLVQSQKEKALIYFYNCRMAQLSSQAAVGSTIGRTKSFHSLYQAKLQHPDHTTVVEVGESLSLLVSVYSVQAFLTNAYVTTVLLHHIISKKEKKGVNKQRMHQPCNRHQAIFFPHTPPPFFREISTCRERN